MVVNHKSRDALAVEFSLGGRLNVLASAAQRGRSLGRSKLSANATYDRSWERPGAEAAVCSTTSGIPGAGALYTSYPMSYPL